MDKIDEIVDRAIQYTEKILGQAPRHYKVAREGLEKMRDSLATGLENHPALGRLDKYIGELGRRFAQ